MNTEARQRMQALIGELMMEYSAAPDWERAARIMAEMFTLTFAPGVDPAQVDLAAVVASGFVKRTELAGLLGGTPASEAP